MRVYFVGLLAVTLFSRQLSGQAGPPSPPPLPQVACPPQGCNVGNSHVVHISSRADVRLQSGVLHYLTGQVLQNNGGENAEVIWTLPLPPSAAFHNLTMSIYGEMILGEIYSKARARAIYNAIVATKKDPALVEWVNRNLLTTSIYPILPAETKYVEMRLDAVARQTGNVIRVDYFAGSNYARHLAPDVATVTMTFTYPDSAHYGAPFSNTHAVSSPTVAGGMRTVTVNGSATNATLFLPVVNAQAGSISVLPHAAAGEDGYALINVTAPTLPRREGPRDVVIVADVSSSMVGRNFNHASEAVDAALSALGPRDRFRIVAFSGSVRSSDTRLVAATPRNIARARRFMNGLLPAGSTNTVAALEDALKSFSAVVDNRSHTVLLLTDGAPSAGEVRYDSILSRVEARRGRAQLTVFQLGADHSGIELLKDLAQLGGGTVYLTGNGDSIGNHVGAIIRSTTVPAITGLRMQAWPVALDATGSAALENMRPGETRTIAVRYRGFGTATVTVSGVADGRRLTWSEAAYFPPREPGNAFAARFWATEKVGAIALNAQSGCPWPGADSLMATLGTRHAIPTKMTSYLVLEPGVKIGPNGEVLNAADFATGKSAGASGASAAGRSGSAAVGTGRALTLIGVLSPGLTDPTAGAKVPLSNANLRSDRLEVPPAGSPPDLLASRVSGLTIRGGDGPGSDVVIQIRNPLSLVGSTQPMIIVDGVIQMQDDPSLGGRPMRGNLLDVVWEDIETIEIVRGMAAAGLYGQRAANGVINITTRRGSGWSTSNSGTWGQPRDVAPPSALQRACRALSPAELGN